MLEILPVTKCHLRGLGIGPIPRTIRGMAIVRGEEVLALGGIYLEHDHYVMAAEVSEEMHRALRRGRYVREFMRCARAVLALAKPGIPVYSLADPDKYGSARVLEHLGFHQVMKDTWRWPTSG